MLRLALDTSTRLGTVGLAEDATLLGESSLSVRAAHSETVMPEVRRLLDRADRRPDEIGQVVVGAGPGSFTGVRIAAACAKGLRAATGAELMAFSSLAAISAGTGIRERVCALLDARRDELYAAAYRSLGPLEPALEPMVASLPEVLERIGDPTAWTFAGPGALSHRERLEGRGGTVLDQAHAYPRAATLLDLARAVPDEGRIRDPETWEPDYVRASGAERGIGA